MLKICKNMQNIQNMHSCFKNAALCMPNAWCPGLQKQRQGPEAHKMRLTRAAWCSQD